MNPQNVMSIFTAFAAVAVSVLSVLPYSWARLAAGGLGAGIAGIHGSSYAFGTLNKPGKDNAPPA